MRAYSWIALGTFALACGGSAFTQTDGGGGSGSDAGGSSSGKGGTLGHAGKGVGGSVLGNGGKVGTAGAVGIGGDVTTGGGISVGGDVTVGGSLAMGGDTGSAGAGPDPIDETCPVDLPGNGGGCADGLTCSYGSDIRPSCRARAQCDNGAWNVEQANCEAIHACGAIVQGTECDGQVAQDCTIQTSIFCTCTGCTGAGPCSSNTVWQCASGSGGQGCPSLIPNAGQTCVGSAVCGYGSCTTGERVTATCNGATWGWESMTCPQ